MQNQKQVLVPVADGCEEIETVSIVDVLRRGGIQVTLASIQSVTDNYPIVQGSNGIKILCDTYLTEQVLNSQYDMIALPGGVKNSESLSQHLQLIERLKQQKSQGKWIAAICASPCLVFDAHGLLEGETGTCHPNFADKFTKKEKIEERVVISNNVITSRSPGTAIEFGLALVEQLVDSQKALQLAKVMVVRK